jgi:4-amino-4-deoxy-L-arabinose transferase-like glycosyltransferase
MNGRLADALQSRYGMLLLALLILAVLTATALVLRPLTPIDETRYVGVAWEMWLRGDFLLPFKNGAPYSHKPPLMIWLFQAGWAAFGVNEWWPRLVSPLVSAANLLLTMTLARRLWPGRTDIAGPAVLVLCSCLLWTFFSTAAMFDIIVAFFTLLGMHGTLLVAEGKLRRGFVCLGVAIGLGVLTKGPVILLHVLPVALLAPWWTAQRRWGRWFGGVLLAVLLGAAIALAWAIPAGMAGGEEYRKAIFFGQTANRMVESFAHKRPLWWYLPLLPVMLFPWLVWPGLWRALGSFVRHDLDRGGRFCLAWMLPVLVAFSLISGKQPHYLIPLFPAFALFAARALVDEQRVRGLWLPLLAALLMGMALLLMAAGWLGTPWEIAGPPEIWPGLLLMAAAAGVYVLCRRVSKPLAALALFGAMASALLQLALIAPLYPAYDVRIMAAAIHQAQASGHPVAHLGDYNDQFHFAGRLQTPLALPDNDEALKAWLRVHPDGDAVIYTKDMRRLADVKAIAAQPYLAGGVALLDAPAAMAWLAAQPASDKH